MIFFQYWDKGFENMPDNYKINWNHNIKIIKKMNLKYIFLDDKNIVKYIPIHKNFKYLIPAHKADYIRVFFPYLYGGIYIDSDCIIINDFSSLLKKLNNKYNVILFADHNYYGKIDYMNGILIMKKKTKFCEYFIKIINKKLNKINNYNYDFIKIWCFIGAEIINNIVYKVKIFNDQILFINRELLKNEHSSSMYFDWFYTSKNNKKNKNILYKKLFFKNEKEACKKALLLKKTYQNKYFLLTNRLHNFFKIDDIYYSKKSIIYHLMKQSLNY